MKTGFASFMAIALFLGCSGSEEGPGSDTSSLTTPAKFCSAWAKAACNEQVVDYCGGNDVADCVESQQAFCLDMLPFGYDPKFAQECIDAVDAAYEDADLTAEELNLVLKLGAPCDRLIKGAGDAGDTCSTHTDCNTLQDLTCVVKSGATEGTCQVPVEVGGGQKCTAAEQVCAPGFYCGGSNCLAYKDLGDECSFDSECAPEHRCSASPTGECVARAKDGDDCASDAECASLLCAVARGTTEGVCVSEVRLSAAIPLCQDLR